MRAPILNPIPCPTWLAHGLSKHAEQRRLTLEIWMLSDKGTAFFALWVSRLAAVTSRTLTVEDGLRAFKALLLR